MQDYNAALGWLVFYCGKFSRVARPFLSEGLGPFRISQDLGPAKLAGRKSLMFACAARRSNLCGPCKYHVCGAGGRALEIHEHRQLTGIVWPP